MRFRGLKDAQVAQLVEQRIENPRVGGSIPSLGTIFRRIALALTCFVRGAEFAPVAVHGVSAMPDPTEKCHFPDIWRC